MTEFNNDPHDPQSPLYIYGPMPPKNDLERHSPPLTEKDLRSVLHIMQKKQAEMFADFLRNNNVLEIVFNQLNFEADQQIDAKVDNSKRQIIKAVIKAVDTKYATIIADLQAQILALEEQNEQLSEQNVDIAAKYDKIVVRQKLHKTKIADLTARHKDFAAKTNKSIEILEYRLGTMADVVNIVREQFWAREKMLKQQQQHKTQPKVKKGKK